MALAPHICVVGSSNVDLMFRTPRLPRSGETLLGHSFHLGYGGKGANQAVMAARLGARVSMISKIGRDIFGEGTLRNFREQGVDARQVGIEDGVASGVAGIIVDDAAQNCIVVAAGANLRLTPKDVMQAADTIRSADLLLCQCETPLETTLAAFQSARRAGALTILNPAPAMDLPSELLRLTDICVPNESELETLTEQATNTLEQVEVAARKLRRRGVTTIIVTLGEKGALLLDTEAAEFIAALPVQAVDSTGAGDAFIGSLAVFLGEKCGLREAVRRANVAAGLSVARIGTQASFPTRAEVEERL